MIYCIDLILYTEIIIITNGTLNFGANNLYWVTVSAVNSTGRVGIAKTSPNSTLDVNGDVTITGSLTTTNTNSSIAFSASNASYWTGSPPATLQEALNRIAEAIFNGITGSIA